jgi:hypothetical protein
MTAQMLQGLGSMMVQYAIKAKAFAELAQTIQTFITSHPILAIGAAVAMIALGTALGGRRSGGTGGRGNVGGGARATGPDITRLQVADRGFLPPSARPSRTAASPAVAPVIINTTLLNPADPATQRVLSMAMKGATGRGF